MLRHRQPERLEGCTDGRVVLPPDAATVARRSRGADVGISPRRAAKPYERAATEEDAVWRNLIAPCLDRFTQPPAMRVLEYGSMEMINNARDHSEGRGVTVRVDVDIAFATVWFSDDGEGIFARIKTVVRP